MREITLEELLGAGCHFGHQVTRSNPKARDFIFETRNNISIIDLVKTRQTLEAAGHFVKELAEKGKTLIVVGTKSQAREVVREAMAKTEENKLGENLYWVTARWVGGLLTNLSEVKKNFKRLKDLEFFLGNEEERSKYTKKEISLFQKEKQKLADLYEGVKNLEKTPDALFIIDTHLEDLAVREAKKTKVATVGITDTNADPYLIDYPIAANDDALGSIKLIVDYIIDAWIEGRKNPESGAKDRELDIEKSDAREREKEVKADKKPKEKEKKSNPKEQNPKEQKSKPGLKPKVKKA
ncbi:MAG: 30S ribosomal protein S2 [Patescibacteria group bacterium]|nr:30S ribosomal protein S2 [Patescibacteria group bacterium]